MKNFLKRILQICVIGFILSSNQSFAAGYKLEFQSPSVLADGGDAAVVEDAGTNWYNSAGLILLPQQLVVSTTHVYEATVFSGTVTAPSITLPIRRTRFVENGRASTYTNVDLPAIHYSYPFWCNNYAFGLSIVPVWGLLGDYGPKSLLRYDLDRIYTRTIDIAPSLAIKINDCLSVGFGPDMHFWYLSSKTHVRTQPLTRGDSISRLSADDWAWGAHIGALLHLGEPGQETRIGINYRSRITMKMGGYDDFAFDSGPAFESNTNHFTIPLPPTTTISAYQDITPCWALMGSITFDQWSIIRNIHGHNSITPRGTLTDIVIVEDLHNTFDFTVGTHYRINDCLLLRGALKYEQTPTNSQHRDVNFPDAEKLAINLGARYCVTPKVAIDAIYVHVFTPKVNINQTNSFFANTNGRSSTSIDAAGVQLVWSI